MCEFAMNALKLPGRPTRVRGAGGRQTQVHAARLDEFVQELRGAAIAQGLLLRRAQANAPGSIAGFAHDQTVGHVALGSALEDQHQGGLLAFDVVPLEFGQTRPLGEQQCLQLIQLALEIAQLVDAGQEIALGQQRLFAQQAVFAGLDAREQIAQQQVASAQLLGVEIAIALGLAQPIQLRAQEVAILA
jgi:hypothetical protein